MNSKKIIAALGLLLVLTACGDQEPPKAPVGEGTPAEPPKTCPVVPPKTCTGGAVPTLDQATCTQLCPGE